MHIFIFVCVCVNNPCVIITIQVEQLNDSIRQSSQKTVNELLGYNSLYRAQLAEMGSRLEQARKQGQKVAEIKKSGEISALQEQLGSKSK